jgi:Helix-turn-helix domain
MTAATRLAASPKTFEARDDWMRAVLAADLPDAAARLAVRIGLHLRVKTGKCNPSYATLAAESRIGERSAYRLVALLEAAGWLAVQRTRGRLSNQYVLLNPANAMAGLNPAKTRARNPAKSTRQPCQQAADKKRNKIPSRGCLPATPLMVGERDALTRDESSAVVGDPPLARDPAEKLNPNLDAADSTAPPDSRLDTLLTLAAKSYSRLDNIAGTRLKSEARCTQSKFGFSAPNSGQVHLTGHAANDFDVLRDLWQRGWASDDTPKAQAIARAAFAKACARAEADAILDGAQAWVDAFAAGDGVRFLPALPQWLAGRGWQRPPPTKRSRHGGTRRRRDDGLPRSNGRKVDMGKLALAYGGYVEDASGAMVWGGQ